MAKQVKCYALLIVDMQNDLVLPGSPLRVLGAKATISVIHKVLKTKLGQGKIIEGNDLGIGKGAG